MRNKTISLLRIAMLFILSATVFAGGVKYENDKGQWLKIGGRIQIQYHVENPDGGPTKDELFLRRLRPFVEASVHENWIGKFQWDFGLGKVEPREVYMQYSDSDNLLIRIGNTEFPFSREFTTSNKKQQLVERTFVGDSKRGTPDRQTGIHLHGNDLDKKITWRGAAVIASQVPDTKKLDFRTAISLYQDDDWSQGPMVGARIDFHPQGFLDYSQGDFEREFKTTIGISGYAWQNDEDNLDVTRSNDVDSVTGLEISGALRGGGLSIDAQYNLLTSKLVDENITSGMYEDSETIINQYSVEGGYMIVPSKVELAAGYQSQDTDNYEDPWTRTSLGLNYYLKKHNIKFQCTYRINENKDGEAGNDIDEIFIQSQYVF